MSTLQNIDLAPETIKVRWQEPYITAGLNQKALAMTPKGVVAGFSVQPGTGYSVTIVPDPVLNLSIANVLETTAGTFAMTLVQSGSLFVDLTLQAGLTVYLVLDAQYAVGSASSAQLKVVDALDPDFVVLAKVNVPASPIPGGPITAAHINNGYTARSGDSVTELAKPRTNLVFNPDFAAGITDGWGFSGFMTAAASTDAARSDTYSLKLTRSSAGTALATGAPMPVVPGQKYRTSAWLRSDSGSPIAAGNGARVLVSWRLPTDVEISSEGVEDYFTGGGTTFVEVKTEVTAPALATHARVEVLFDGCSGILYVDDVEFSHSRAEALARSSVFGGSSTSADLYHTHTSAGLSYAGGPTWADGSTNPGPVTVEAQLDKILTDLGTTAGTGAAKISFLPVTPKDLVIGVDVRVDLALNKLDDLKAGIDLSNTFSKTNIFTPTVLDAAAITATGNGTGTGVAATGGNIAVSGGVTSATGSAVVGVVNNAVGVGSGVVGITIGTGSGVAGTSTGTGYGVRGQGVAGGVWGTTVSGFGVLGQTASGTGVQGEGTVSGVNGEGLGAGSGVTGQGGPTNGVGVSGVGVGAGYGVYGKGAGGSASIPSKANQGLLGVGGASGIGVEGSGEGAAAGVYGTGGVTNGVGVHGQGSGTGAAVKGTAASTGIGVLGLGAGSAAPLSAGEGVYGIGSTADGTGVFGKGGATNGIGVLGSGTGTGAGVKGTASVATADGVVGVGLGGSYTPVGKVGVYGAGGSSSGTGVRGKGGTVDGVGVFGEGTGDGIGVKATASGTGAAVEGITTGGGYGVLGSSPGLGGVRGVGTDTAVPGGYFTGGAGAFGILVDTGASGPGGRITGNGNHALRLEQTGGFATSLKADGYIDLNGGGSPALGDGLNNNLTKANIVAHWAVIQMGVAGADYNILAGYNVNNAASPVKRSGNTFFLNFIGTMASANYYCEVSAETGQDVPAGSYIKAVLVPGASTSALVAFSFLDGTFAQVAFNDADLNNRIVRISVIGPH